LGCNPPADEASRPCCVSLATNLVAGDTNGVYDIFVFDRDTNTTERVSISSTGEQGNGGSAHPSISADGRYVTYYSEATNLVAGDTNRYADIFVFDRDTHTTERVSVSSNGDEGNETVGRQPGTGAGHFRLPGPA
jgi:Tol biopolymer transport system component